MKKILKGMGLDLREKMLIIGGFGFLGSALVEKYCQIYDIVVLDSNDYTKSSLGLRNINYLKNIDIIRGDAINYCTFRQLGNNFDYIINTAAVLGIETVAKESIRTISTNIKVAENALEFSCLQHNLKRFVNFSTSEVYGREAISPTEGDDTIIACAKEARWCYAASKVLTDHMAMAYAREKHLNVLIVRPFNIFGEYRLGNNAITQLITRMLDGKPVYISGEGNNVRCWCHIDDFTECFKLALSTAPRNEIINIGNPENEIDMLSLARMIHELTESTSKIIVTHSKEPDVSYRKPSIQIASDLGFSPKVSLIEGLKRTIKWHISTRIDKFSKQEEKIELYNLK